MSAPRRAPAPPILRFARDNAPWLGAGALMTFGSSFGQTFFISLFAGEIRAEFSLSHGEWGAAYTTGTMASAALMLWAGGLTDRFRARTVTVLVLCGLALAALSMSRVAGWWGLAGAIFGLRFCGQGMLFHTSIVSMGRWFHATRGRAVALANLGYATGEAALPVIFVLLIGLIGWRASWIVAAGAALALAPLALRLLRAERTPRSQSAQGQAPGMENRHWRRADALKHWLFWVTLPGFLTHPAFSTAFFFQQVQICVEKGWDLVDFASLYPIAVLSAIGSMFLGGWIADRFGSARLLPIFLAPMALGFLAAWGFEGLWAGGAALAGLGMMQGLSTAASGAFWPEFYGTRHLGAIRAVASSTMVFATALGPGISGWLIDAGVPVTSQLAWMAGYALLMCGLFAFAMHRVGRAPG